MPEKGKVKCKRAMAQDLSVYLPFLRPRPIEQDQHDFSSGVRPWRFAVLCVEYLLL